MVSIDVVGQNQEIVLKNLIQAVLDSPGFKKLSSFRSNFEELLQRSVDPPFEAIWVHSALRYRGFSSTENDLFKRLAAVKGLFQLIVSSSVSCDFFKSIALIAPVMYNVFGLVMGLKGFQQKAKKEKKFVREVNGLVDSILGYVNVCCEGVEDRCDVSEGFLRPVRELVTVWMWDKSLENTGDKGCMRAFFPLLTDEIIERVNAEGCELSALAGCVIAEAFLLKLCLRFLEDGSRKELQDELRAWIIASITGLQNPYFFETLLMMLLEPSFPKASLLNSDDEKCLRNILYDAVVLVEYSFLNPEQMDQLSAKHVKNIIMARLLITGEAIELNSLPPQIITWIRSKIGAEDKASEPSSSSPATFLRWILNIENGGIRIFDHNISKIRAKSLLDSMTEGFEQPALKDAKKKSENDILFYIDNKGEEDEEEGDEKMNESDSAAFVSAAHTMESAEPERRKRKGKDSEQKSRVKFLKYSLHENSGSKGKPSIADNDDSSSEGEVENPLTDEE
ncbi:uncharacterized protein [Solanum lycopersicum]|uniref:uncharacterized protein isoform X2 n=1 Tax=Solanum lycopersicum TaxID=4081 RepID=UPI000532A9CA|nr:uncharacterized protein LOC101266738 isoform X2 [Solanum lycopersicum]